MRKILQSLLGLLPTPKSVVGLVGYFLVALYPISLVLNFLSNADLVAANVEWIEYVLRQWWGYPLFMILGFVVLLYAGYKQQSRQTLHAVAHPQPETQPTTTGYEDAVEQLKVQLAATRQELAEAQQTIRSQRKVMEDEHGVVHWGQANAVNIGELAANAEAKRKIQELEAASERLSEELRQSKRELEGLRAGERRKRIEKWRAEIRAHSFGRHPLGTSRFADTETYLEMRPHLPSKIRARFESQVAAALTFVGPAHLRGSEGDKRVLLGEVARLEKEWGVV